MPPIPVHIDDPITPQKPQGATPQTFDSPALVAAAAPASNTSPTTTKNAAAYSPAYPSARPGAAAVPAPTPYIPPQPTRTTALQRNENVPPPPQPGAVPIPPTMTMKTTLPPPPKAGEALQQRKTSPGMSMPSQMNVPSPGQNWAPTHSTTGATYRPAPATTLNMGPVSAAQHPPGYRQNSFAQDLNPAQRSSLEEQERTENFVPGIGGGAAGGGRGGSVAGGMNWEGGNEAVRNLWGTVKGWVGVAGEKLAETEESVWRRINGS